VFVNLVATFIYAAFSTFSFELSGFNVMVSGPSKLSVAPLQRDGYSGLT